MRKKRGIARKIGIALLILILAGVGVLYLTGNGYVFNAIRGTILKGYWTTNIDDHTDFKNNIVEIGEPQYWDLHPMYGKVELSDTLRHELEKHQSIGFAVFKDGMMLYEEYWDGYSDESHTNSFSMAKSITTMLLGKAIQQGYIRGMDQPIIDFIPEFAGDSLGRLCTVGNLAAMNSGYDWKEEYYSPFNQTTKAYFGNNIEKQILSGRFSIRPGGMYKYSSADTQILAIVLKRATGQPLAQYLSESYWKPLGMEHNALWSVSGGLEKSFCCVHSNVRDFAKLGQFLLQKGNWRGEQLLDSAFVELMITPNDSAFAPGQPKKYGRSIWIDREYDPPFYGMMGHLGQRVLVVPEYNLVIVRLGKSKDQNTESKGHLDSDTYLFVDEALKMISAAE